MIYKKVKGIILSFVPIITAITATMITHNMGAKYIQYISHIIYKVINVKSGNQRIDAYFITLWLLVLINLIYSIIGLTNFIDYKHNNVFFYLFTIQHTILCILYGIYKRGLRKIFNNFYYHVGNGVLATLLALVICILQIFMHVIVNTIIMPTRLVVNNLIGHEIHNAMSSIEYGFIMMIIINILKILLYSIQSYIYVIMAYKIYTYICVEPNIANKAQSK